MGNGIARNFKFFTKAAFTSIVSMNAVLALVILFQVTGGIYTQAEGLAETLSGVYFFMGGVVMNFVLFLQWHTSVIPMAIGFNTTRKAVFLVDMFEKVLVTVLQTVIILGIVYFAIQRAGNAEAFQVNMPPFSLAVTIITVLFFAACAGAFFGGLMQLFQKWGVAALVLFIICAVVGIFLFLLSSVGNEAMGLSTFGKTSLMGMWLLNVLFCGGNYVMCKKYTAKG